MRSDREAETTKYIRSTPVAEDSNSVFRLKSEERL